MYNFKDFRPHGFMGKGDRFLPGIVKDLTEFLLEVYDENEYFSLPFDEESMKIIAPILVEFAEDMHNDIGIWDSYERYNLEFFGTRLPLTLEEEYEEELEPGIVPERIFHLMWVVSQELFTDLIISPQSIEIWTLAEEAAHFLEVQFRNVPKSSGVKMFLTQPDDSELEVKKKLIWLGTMSYMFRVLYAGYLEQLDDDEDQEFEFTGLAKSSDNEDKNEEMSDVDKAEYFILKATTGWSGLGVIDILAETLEITQEQQNEIRGWYEPHEAVFKVLSCDGCFIELLNVINDEKYTVIIEKRDIRLFKKGYTISGALIKWDDEWYWTGNKRIYGEFPEKELGLLKDEYNNYVPGLVYIYDKEKLHNDRENLQKRYENFIGNFKNDLVIFPNGKEFSKQIEKFLYNNKKEDILDPIRAEKLKMFEDELPFPKELYKSKKDIGVFFNPVSGVEIVENYNNLINGLSKKGDELTLDEEHIIIEFIFNERISPDFVHKLVKEYGDESIFESFLAVKRDEMSLDYLLRCYKGQYYRNRYPGVM